MSFFQELKRRNVFKVGAAYIVVSWLVAQVLQLVFESFGTPDWVMKTVLVLMGVGLFFALFFAWAFELTPDGLKRERDVDRSQSITAETGKKLNYTIFVVMLLAIGYFAYDNFMLRKNAGVPAEKGTQQVAEGQAPEAAESKPANEPDRSVAVLPFVDMSPAKDQEYFTDGLTENLLNALAKMRELKVAGRTSSFAFKNRNEDLRIIGEQLGVAHLLEGSVQKSGERVRITAQLISAGDGYHLWSETYDRTLEDIFAVQDEIADEVARAMQVALLGTEEATHASPASSNVADAYNDYLKGIYERKQGTVEGNQRAVSYFRRALDKDPNLALAWAGLAVSLDYITGFADGDFSEGFEEARAAALRALEIDPDLPEGHVALAGIQQSHDWDWGAAEASLDRALALRPGDTDIRFERAFLKVVRGDRDTAFAEYQRVAEQDRLDLRVQARLASAYSARGKFEEAERIFDEVIAKRPGWSGLLWNKGNMELKRGNYEAALDSFSREALEFLGITGKAIAYHHLGKKDEAVAALQELISKMGESSSYQIAEVYAQWGDFDNALSWLERGYNIRDPGLQYVGVDALFDPMRDDPRFQAFLRKMNF